MMIRYSIVARLFQELSYLMNGFYILAHDEEKLEETLDLVDETMNELEANHQSECQSRIFTMMSFLWIFQDDRFYADSYGSGLLLRGVLLQFLRRYDEAHQCFDEILNR